MKKSTRRSSRPKTMRTPSAALERNPRRPPAGRSAPTQASAQASEPSPPAALLAAVSSSRVAHASATAGTGASMSRENTHCTGAHVVIQPAIAGPKTTLAPVATWFRLFMRASSPASSEK